MMSNGESLAARASFTVIAATDGPSKTDPAVADWPWHEKEHWK
ncbi:MAG TPA: hypothetical protein VGR14_17570 [Verrucomicrobiae bacterium]|nr:hypothetical protein [Verrucomicrobiae bacterium]